MRQQRGEKMTVYLPFYLFPDLQATAPAMLVAPMLIRRKWDRLQTRISQFTFGQVFRLVGGK